MLKPTMHPEFQTMADTNVQTKSVPPRRHLSDKQASWGLSDITPEIMDAGIKAGPIKQKIAAER